PGHLLVSLVVLRVRGDGGLGDVFRDFSLVFSHLLHAAIVVGNAGGVGDGDFAGGEQLILHLTGGQLFKLFQAGQLVQVTQAKAHQEVFGGLVQHGPADDGFASGGGDQLALE